MIFKIGDRVKIKEPSKEDDACGIVIQIYNKKYPFQYDKIYQYPILVIFDNNQTQYYTSDGHYYRDTVSNRDIEKF